MKLSAAVLPASRVSPPPEGTRLELGRGAHVEINIPQLSIPPPRLNRPDEPRRQPVGCISRGRARPYTRRKNPLILIPRNQVPEGEGTRFVQAPKGSTRTSTVVVKIKLQHVFTARCVRHNKHKLTSRKHTVCFTLFQLFTDIWNYCRK